MKKRKTGITGIADSRSAACAGRLIREKGGCWIVVTPTYGEAERMAADLSFFVKKKICLLPEEEEAVLSFETRSRDNTWGRLRILRTLLEDGDCVVVGAAGAVLEHLPPPQAFTAQCLTLEAGDEVDVAALAGRLVAMGYERVPLVYAPGQFSLRGEILDVFTPYEDDPLRIELFDTEVESLRTFDAETQRSLSHLGSVRLYPATLLVRDEDALTGARQRIGRACRDLPERRRELLEALDSFAGLPRLEMYLDYFYDRPSHLWEYGGEKTPRIFVDDPNRAWEHLEAAEQERRDAFDVYLQQGKAAAADLDHYPSRRDLRALYDSGELWLGMLFARQLHGIEQLDALEHIESRQVLAYNGKLELLERDLRRYAERGYDTVIVCATAERRSNMDEYLVRSGLQGRARVCAGHLSTGMELPQEHRVYLSDADIFGQTRRRRHRHRASMENAQPIRSFADIQSGDYVVHESHGIGRYLGLEQLTVGGEVREYMKIRYAGDDLLYVPAEQTNVIQKYIGSEEAAPKVSRLAGSEWRTTKAKARASVANMAQELLRVSARRASSPGHAFSPDTVWQQQFEDSFPYEETPDQLRCIREIKADMERPQAMDRLLCGDVGYGKTEVAARAMFKCAADGLQVAMLVPTTVLASQHFHNLAERFAAFPFRVEMISRFRSEAEQREVIAGLRDGTVDIVIGTHRLLSDDVAFDRLGLLVIDEEQRFGVAHKEKIKKLRSNVDVLTLSATPIPRTLHMSLLGLRDMSLIEEPPENRYPVQTYVMEEDDEVIREAITRELERGGQVYVVRNRIRGINRLAERIDRLVPGRRIAVCHGRMQEKAMENVMMDVMAGDVDILVATTIIENGIDIPNVNTLIVLDADNFGLSQLYQLRGRVGRSTRLAYAYLLHRPGKVLTEVASKRLRAIRDFTEFGAGFKIAMRDLEIRGAGDLLGSEQHGHIVNVGYELYCKMVDDAVRALQGETVREEHDEVVLDLHVTAYIPDSYIGDATTKLAMYRRIADVGDADGEEAALEELTDRFGRPPREVRTLLAVSRIKSCAEALDIVKVTRQRRRAVLQFHKRCKMPPQTLLLEREGSPLAELLEVLELMRRQRTEKQ